MTGRFTNLLRGLSAHWLGKLGVALVTSSFLLFIFLEILRLLGLLTNAYAGLVTYLSLPLLFIIGLLLIPLGWWRTLKATMDIYGLPGGNSRLPNRRLSNEENAELVAWLEKIHLMH